jgi:hypothetical protein
MIIRILPNQVPRLWEAIKFAAVKANRIEEKDLPFYLNKLLADLLNDKAQCFVRIGEDRQLQAIIITKIIVDMLSGSKGLSINCLYSFESVPNEVWITTMKSLFEFAKASECKIISAYSSNERVFDLVSLVGFTERFRCFSMEVS